MGFPVCQSVFSQSAGSKQRPLQRRDVEGVAPVPARPAGVHDDGRPGVDPGRLLPHDPGRAGHRAGDNLERVPDVVEDQQRVGDEKNRTPLLLRIEFHDGICYPRNRRQTHTVCTFSLEK
jgi:hypothetical protein